MTTWEEIRDETAEMLADGQPLEDVIGNLEKRKNEMAKANLLKAMDEMKKREQTNEEWFDSLNTEEKADLFCTVQNHLTIYGDHIATYEDWVKWLKEKHHAN